MADSFNQYDNPDFPEEPNSKDTLHNEPFSPPQNPIEDLPLSTFSPQSRQEGRPLPSPYPNIEGDVPYETPHHHPLKENEDPYSKQVYRVSSAEAPDFSGYTLPPLDDELPPEEAEPEGWKTAWAVIREVGETIILTLIIFFVIQAFIRNFRVVGTSMIGNLHDGQYLIIDKVTYNEFLNDTLGIAGPQRGDVIVFEPPNRPDDDYVKRIIGLPGETVEIIGGQVYIDGVPLDEPFQPNQGSYTIPPQVVPDGQVFVLGDNRNNSNDSHTWGPLPIENIVGRAWISYWPPVHWGTIPRDAPTSQATLKHLVDSLVPNANAENE